MPEFSSIADASLRAKLQACGRIIRSTGGLVVACSGGVDSGLLLALAAAELGTSKVLAAHACGAIFPRHEQRLAHDLAERLGVRIVDVPVEPLADPGFVANPPDRCYHCKKAIFGGLLELARREGLPAVASGANADDTGDYRPGLAAEKELGIRQPLMEAGMGKADIRAAVHALGLDAWDTPSAACLASRIPYGQTITRETLARIDRGEEILRGTGLTQCRLRDHGAVARIEVLPAEIPTVLANREALASALKALGYTFIALDLEGFRSGSLNRLLGQ